MCTTRLIATCWNSSKTSPPDSPALVSVSVFANRIGCPMAEPLTLSPPCLLSPPFLSAVSRSGPFLNIFKRKLYVLFLLIDQVCKCVLKKKKNQSLFINRIVYLKRRSFLINIKLWYALIPFVTVVTKALFTGEWCKQLYRFVHCV